MKENYCKDNISKGNKNRSQKLINSYRVEYFSQNTSNEITSKSNFGNLKQTKMLSLINHQTRFKTSKKQSNKNQSCIFNIISPSIEATGAVNNKLEKLPSIQNLKVKKQFLINLKKIHNKENSDIEKKEKLDLESKLKPSKIKDYFKKLLSSQIKLKIFEQENEKTDKIKLDTTNQFNIIEKMENSLKKNEDFLELNPFSTIYLKNHLEKADLTDFSIVSFKYLLISCFRRDDKYFQWLNYFLNDLEILRNIKKLAHFTPIKNSIKLNEIKK